MRGGRGLRSLQQRSQGEATTSVLGNKARNSLQSCVGRSEPHAATPAQEMAQALPARTRVPPQATQQPPSPPDFPLTDGGGPDSFCGWQYRARMTFFALKD